MQIGQIVYRLQNYRNRKSEVSTNKKGIVVEGMGDLDMTSNLFGQFAEGVSYRNAKITKLGVQAPPHTKMVIDGRDIQVGNTLVFMSLMMILLLRKLNLRLVKNYRM